MVRLAGDGQAVMILIDLELFDILLLLFVHEV